MAEELLTWGADVKATILMETPLHLAARHDLFTMVPLLVAAGADLQAVDTMGQSALHVAAREAGAETVQALVACGADVEAGEHMGNHTPLHLAAMYGNNNSAKALLAAGANVDGGKRKVSDELAEILQAGAKQFGVKLDDSAMFLPHPFELCKSRGACQHSEDAA